MVRSFHQFSYFFIVSGDRVLKRGRDYGEEKSIVFISEKLSWETCIKEETNRFNWLEWSVHIGIIIRTELGEVGQRRDFSWQDWDLNSGLVLVGRYCTTLAILPALEYRFF
jgi:hypothetical protein